MTVSWRFAYWWSAYANFNMGSLKRISFSRSLIQCTPRVYGISSDLTGFLQGSLVRWLACGLGQSFNQWSGGGGASPHPPYNAKSVSPSMRVSMPFPSRRPPGRICWLAHELHGFPLLSSTRDFHRSKPMNRIGSWVTCYVRKQFSSKWCFI